MDNEKNSEQKYSFQISGMTCASCVRIVERSLKKIPGVNYATVNLATEKGFVVTDSTVSIETLSEAVKNSGYKLELQKSPADILYQKLHVIRKRFFLALSFTTPAMILMIIEMSGYKIPYFTAIEFILSLLTLTTAGYPILKGAFIALIHRHTNMDTLIMLGAVSALATNILALSGFHIMPFGSIAAMLVSLHLLGRYIEAQLKARATEKISALLSLQKSSANLISGDSQIIEVPSDNIKNGEIVLVRSGERIPVDGIIVEGSGSIDESMISGEPLPLKKSVNNETIGGTILNDGLLKIKATNVGEDSFLATMIKLVEEAQSARVPLQALADRITLYFIPAVFTLAVLGALYWFYLGSSAPHWLVNLQNALPWETHHLNKISMSLFIFVSVLVIACPCALGLATPMALLASSSTAARRGLIIKNGEAFSSSRKINTIFFDKTGTLTVGKPQVMESNLSEADFNILASLERNSQHPLAKAICEYYPIVEQIEFTDITEIAGSGISGKYNGKLYKIGKPTNPDKYKKIMSRGWTVIEFSVNDIITGYVTITDKIKNNAVSVLTELAKRNIKTIMITGDNELTAAAVAREIGITSYIAGVKPSEKADHIRKQQIIGSVTAMVGDGINDAVALKQADIGVALSSGTQIAIESADLIIVNNNLETILDAIDIASLTYKKINQNLFWAFFYNLIALPTALLGIIHPAIAEVAMTFSSLNVIINSGSINRFKKNNNMEK